MRTLLELGLVASVKRLASTALALAHNRIELFGMELRDEQKRLIEGMVLAALSFFLGLMALSLGTFAIVVAFWESARMAAILVLCAVYAAGAIIAWYRLRSRMNAQAPFAGTLAELDKDRKCLGLDVP